VSPLSASQKGQEEKQTPLSAAGEERVVQRSVDRVSQISYSKYFDEFINYFSLRKYIAHLLFLFVLSKG
jgi:hypothetical protein